MSSTLISRFTGALCFSRLPLLVCMLFVPIAAAMDVVSPGFPDGDETSTVVYDAAFFSRFNPINAYDILDRIPGAKAILDAESDDGGQRGFGSTGDQILINGKRIAGKANQISSALERIQAVQVERVEIIRGNSAGLDVRNEGNIINVVIQGGAQQAAGTWKVTSAFYDKGDVVPEAYASYSGTRDRLDYFVSAELSSFYQKQTAREFFMHEDFVLHEDRHESQRSDWNYGTLTSNLIYQFSNGDELRLNALIEEVDAPTREEIYRNFIDQGEIQRQFADTRYSVEDTLEWELGADLVHNIGNAKLDLLALYTLRDNTDDQPQDRIENGTRTPRSYDITSTIDSEAILRAAYHLPVAERHNLELGAEAAYNELDKSFVLFLPDAQGVLRQADVFNADSVVDEVRYELFSTHGWAITEQLNLETGLNIEYSQISQSGSDVSRSRDFTYLKPRFDLRYDINSAQQIRFKLERTVNQLNFGSFVSFFDAEIDTVQGGNPELEPERAWEYEFAYDYRLAEDRGVIKTRFFYQDIEEHESKVGISAEQSVPGNIGDAEIYGAELDTSLRLTGLGLPDAVVSLNYLWRDSAVTDPFTGIERKVNWLDDYVWSLGFRHDITRIDLSYGVDISDTGPYRFYDIDEIEKSDRGADATIFIEKRVWGEVKLRAEGFQLLGNKYRRTKVRGIIPQHMISRREQIDRRDVSGVRLILTGSF